MISLVYQLSVSGTSLNISLEILENITGLTALETGVACCGILVFVFSYILYGHTERSVSVVSLDGIQSTWGEIYFAKLGAFLGPQVSCADGLAWSSGQRVAWWSALNLSMHATCMSVVLSQWVFISKRTLLEVASGIE